MTTITVNGKTQYVVHGVFGTDAVRNLEDYQVYKSEVSEEQLEDAENDFSMEGGAELFRMFDTEGEAHAYMQGLADMDGWLSYAFTEKEEHEALYGAIDAKAVSGYNS